MGALSSASEPSAKERILADGAPRVVEVEVPGWGRLTLRELSIEDVAALKGDTTSSALIAASVMNGAGPMFTIEEIGRLAAGRARAAIAALVDEIDKLNALSPARQQDIAKN